MADILFEIWQDDDSSSFEMSKISERGDELRLAVSPNAVLIHSFTAQSDFEAFQKHYDWQGWGEWKPPANLAEHFYTDEEAEVQRRYLSVRNVR